MILLSLRHMYLEFHPDLRVLGYHPMLTIGYVITCSAVSIQVRRIQACVGMEIDGIP